MGCGLMATLLAGGQTRTSYDLAAPAPRARNRSQGRPRLRKCHGFETDLGAIVVRQLRKPRSNKINMSSDLRPYTRHTTFPRDTTFVRLDAMSW
jgi:hypothetical protein